MAEKKFLLRETIHPQTKQTVYLISEVGVQAKPVVLLNLLESLKQFVLQNAKEPQLSLITIWRCRPTSTFRSPW
ncbi:hypothetical protein, partial [Metamycoplasma hyosynoviae]|uniref:hypothetical protein n=1 Tax=Metamycoplasma hyosynoviae TaxID=29559 RepID=UPI00235950B4